MAARNINTVEFSHLHREVKAHINTLQVHQNGIVQLFLGPQKVTDRMYDFQIVERVKA